jgi:hypothetical protein
MHPLDSHFLAYVGGVLSLAALDSLGRWVQYRLRVKARLKQWCAVRG